MASETIRIFAQSVFTLRCDGDNRWEIIDWHVKFCMRIDDNHTDTVNFLNMATSRSTVVV
jgi:hypothetical protein